MTVNNPEEPGYGGPGFPLYGKIEDGQVTSVIHAPTQPGYDTDGTWLDFSHPAIRDDWLERNGYVEIVETERPEDTDEVRHLLNYLVEDGVPTQLWVAVPNDGNRYVYVGGQKTEEWDHESRVYTRWEDGEEVESRPFNFAENEAADEALLSAVMLEDLTARVARIEAHLWPAEPDPEPDPGNPADPPAGVKTWEDWGGVWPNQTLLLDGGKTYRNISGVPLTTPPSAFPDGGAAWVGQLFEVVLQGEGPDPDPDPDPERPEGYVGPWDKDDTYAVGDVVDKDGFYWECQIPHGAEYQGTWAPGVAHNVWTNIGTV